MPSQWQQSGKTAYWWEVLDELQKGGKSDLVATAATMKDLEHILRSSNHSLVTDPSSTNESSS
ncbi:hypothetical protein [Brevibacillus choshinensis]|uniref:hypothetical protein n=1 Tax=Brevibacillus choshinensis TaxID=54911 RepID=UPI000B22FB28|nr:hypothetical protein [Brevibacillus choshinensis]